MLDIDGVLRFLAIDIALINEDGYWARGSDYNLFCDATGKFHLVPHDMNEAFMPALGPGRGPGMRGGARGDQPGGPAGVPQVALDPLVGLDDPTKPLRSRLLMVPSLRQRFLRYVHEIASDSLDWEKLAPMVAEYRTLIGDVVAGDTRKLASTAAFEAATATEGARADLVPEGGRRRGELSLREFATRRREYLLNHEQVRTAGEKDRSGR
jgi:hypothetical protein